MLGLETDGDMMSKIQFPRRGGEPQPHERLWLAIEDLDREIAKNRAATGLIPLDLYRARQILENALVRCGFKNRKPL